MNLSLQKLNQPLKSSQGKKSMRLGNIVTVLQSQND